MLSCLLPKGISILSRIVEKTGALSGQLQTMERRLWKNVRLQNSQTRYLNLLKHEREHDEKEMHNTKLNRYKFFLCYM